MCFLTKRARQTAQAKALAAQSNPSPCTTCNEHSPAQLVTLVQTMSRADFRQLKHEVKQERRAIKAEMKAYKRENKADWKMAKCERKAMKRAVKAQLWSDIIARHGQGQREGDGQGQGGVVEYQTLQDDGGIERGIGSSPPGYYEVVEKKDMKA